MKIPHTEKFVLLISIFIISCLFYFSLRAEKIVNSVNLNGVVDKVVYDSKGIPSVKINGKTYYLDFTDWNANNAKIVKGDFIVKSRNASLIKVIKHDGKEVVFNVY